MKTALIAAALLLAATAIAIAPSAAAQPSPLDDLRQQCDLDPTDGFVYCHVGEGCVWVNLSGGQRYCA